ncbi:hypothetical protein ACIQMJ_11815 [Actinosynnema sp. NPDC091369]
MAVAEQYPDVEVTVEGVTDYEGEMKIRMTTKSYGDVLLIPNALATDQLPRYFEPLGPVSRLSAEYRFVTERAYRDEVYGLAITGNASGSSTTNACGPTRVSPRPRKHPPRSSTHCAASATELKRFRSTRTTATGGRSRNGRTRAAPSPPTRRRPA